MSYCTLCGAYIPMGQTKCPACGYEQKQSSGAAVQSAPQPKWEEQQSRQQEHRWEQEAQSTSHVEYEVFDGENEQTRRMSALCYVGPLFFVPLLLKKDSEYIRFHANQGLALFLAELAAFGVFHGLIGLGLKLGCIYLAVQGVKNAAAGIREKLPVIGNWKLLKG